MPRSLNIRMTGLERHINAWAAEKNGAGADPPVPAYDKFDHYMRKGDEFGDPLPISRYMKLWKASKNTILKWQTIWHEDNGK